MHLICSSCFFNLVIIWFVSISRVDCFTVLNGLILTWIENKLIETEKWNFFVENVHQYQSILQYHLDLYILVHRILHKD